MPKTKTPRPAEKVAADLDAVNKKRDALRDEAKTFAAELDEAVAYEAAVAAVENMPDTERAALAQVIAAHGADATSKTGTPGK